MTPKPGLIPEWCNSCNAERYFLVENLETSHLLRCEQCGNLSSAVWCPKCGMGGDFVKDLVKRPPDWECPQCHRQYQLPSDFYSHPVDLLRDLHVPPEHRTELEKLTARPKGLPSSVSRAVAGLARPAAAVLLVGFGLLLVIHVSSLLTHTYFFPFPEAFFLLAMAAFIIGLAPADNRMPIKHFYRQYLHPMHPVIRWLPFAFLAYSVVTYFLLGRVTGGARMADLPPAAAAEAAYIQGLCLQSFLLGLTLFGGLILWQRSRQPPSP